jgi:CobQ-like glutamine amidotransferase family enzyme
MFILNICHLYPDLLNLYGDRGNMIALKKRCEWREIETAFTSLSIGDEFDAERYDIVFIGGGQDYEQSILQPDLLDQKSGEIKNYINSGKVMLAICGGYQLLGSYYKMPDGTELKFTGALDLWSVAGNKRMIGNMAFQCDFVMPGSSDGILVGFENHSGKTYLGEHVKPLGHVLVGNGNNGEDHMEGAVFKNTYCSYSHGSLLPKNPWFADHLIGAALKQKYADFNTLAPLDDTAEKAASEAALKMIGL